MPEQTEYTDGRMLVAWTGAAGARDPIGLTSQVKYMRESFQQTGHAPALILCVVADGELESAVGRIKDALDRAPEVPS